MIFSKEYITLSKVNLKKLWFYVKQKIVPVNDDQEVFHEEVEP